MRRVSRLPDVFASVSSSRSEADEFVLNQSAGRDTREPLPRRAWRALTVGCVGFSLMSFNTTSMNLAFGDIGEDFPEASQATVSWVASIFFIGLASLMLLSGGLADRFGRLRMFRLGLVIFAIGAVASAVAPTIWVLIGARLLAAIGGAIVVPSSLAAVLPEFPKERHSTAVALWSATGPVASSIAPATAAVVLAVWNWRVLLVLSAPLALFALLASYGTMRESKAERVSGGIDVFGVIVGSLAIAAIVFAVGQGSNLGWSSPLVLGAFAAAMTLLPLFVFSSRRHDDPLLNLEIFLIKPVWIANLANFMLNISGLGMWILWPLFMSRVWGFSKLQIGLALMPAPVVSGILSSLSGKLAERFGHERLVRWGAIVPIAGLAWPLLTLTEDPNYWISAAPSITLFGAGWAVTQPPLNASVIRHVSADYYGEVNAAFNTIRNIAGALGIAIAIAIIGEPDRADRLAAYDRVFWVFVVSAIASWALLAFAYPRSETQASTSA